MKKIYLSLFLLFILNQCTTPGSALLSPVITGAKTGSVYQAGLSYGSNEIITKYTGKTPIENVKEIASNKKNIQKQTLESEEFYILVKNKIDKTGSILKKSNQ